MDSFRMKAKFSSEQVFERTGKGRVGDNEGNDHTDNQYYAAQRLRLYKFPERFEIDHFSHADNIANRAEMQLCELLYFSSKNHLINMLRHI